MTYYSGPLEFEGSMREIYDCVSDGFKSVGATIDERSDRLDNNFSHFMTLVVQPAKTDFPVLSIFVDGEGRGFTGLSNSSPFETASALYRFGKEEAVELKEVFGGFFGTGIDLNFQRAIFQNPLKLYFLAYYGNERLLKREILKDSLRGKNYFRFAESVDMELLDICIANYRKWIEFSEGEVFVFPVQNIIKIAFGLPKAEEKIDRSVIIELSRLFRSEVTARHRDLRISSVTPDMRIDRPVATVFEIDLADSKRIMRELSRIYEFYSYCVEKAVQGMVSTIDRDFPLKATGD